MPGDNPEGTSHLSKYHGPGAERIRAENAWASQKVGIREIERKHENFGGRDEFSYH